MIRSAMGRRGFSLAPTVGNYKKRYQHDGKKRNNERRSVCP